MRSSSPPPRPKPSASVSASAPPSDLEESWYPITLAPSTILSSPSSAHLPLVDHDDSASVSSSSVDAGTWETSSSSDAGSADVDVDADVEHSLLGGEAYIDAEATASDLSTSEAELVASTRTTGTATAPNMQLIFPDPTQSAYSSLNGSTPSASVIQGGSTNIDINDDSLGNTATATRRRKPLAITDIADFLFSPSPPPSPSPALWQSRDMNVDWTERASRLWEPSDDVVKMVGEDQYKLLASNPTSLDSSFQAQAAVGGYDHPVNMKDLSDEIMKVARGNDTEAIIKESFIRTVVRDDLKAEHRQVSRAEAVLDRLAATPHKWSLRHSIIALASLLSLALAVVRPFSTPATKDTVPTPVQSSAATTTAKYVSIWDKVPLLSFSDPLPAEIPIARIPDLKLIKKAISLSTKSQTPNTALVPLAGVASALQHRSTSCCSLDVRNSEVALTPVVNTSVWLKTLRQIGKNLTTPPPQQQSPPSLKSESRNGDMNETASNANECQCSYGEIIASDLRSIFHHLAQFTHRDVLLAQVQAFAMEMVQTVTRDIVELTLLATHVYRHGKALAINGSERAVRGAAILQARGNNLSRIALDRASQARQSLPSLWEKVIQRASPEGQFQIVTEGVETLRSSRAVVQAAAGLTEVRSKIDRAQNDGWKAIKKARRGLDTILPARFTKSSVGAGTDAEQVHPPTEQVAMDSSPCSLGPGRLRGRHHRLLHREERRLKQFIVKADDAKKARYRKKSEPVPVPGEKKRSKLLDVFHHAAMPFVINL